VATGPPARHYVLLPRGRITLAKSAVMLHCNKDFDNYEDCMMRRVLNCSIALFAMSIAAAASAQMAPAAAPVAAVAALVIPKIGAIVKSSDGRVLGRVDRVAVKDGVPVSVNLIINGRMAHIPIATISVAQDELVTSLTKAEAGKIG
jgi:hypothetical protein